MYRRKTGNKQNTVVQANNLTYNSEQMPNTDSGTNLRVSPIIIYFYLYKHMPRTHSAQGPALVVFPVLFASVAAFTLLKSTKS